MAGELVLLLQIVSLLARNFLKLRNYFVRECLVTDQFPFEVSDGCPLSILHNRLHVDYIRWHNSLFKLPLELVDGHGESLLSPRVANVVPRRFDVRHSARVDLLNVARDETGPSLAIHGVAKNALNWHAL